jgi:hypothetical protein
MKPLPKEFQFKCDEHSAEQCRLLGINAESFQEIANHLNIESYYVVDNLLLVEGNMFEFDAVPLISLADYIESEPFENWTREEILKWNRDSKLLEVLSTLKLDVPPDIMPDHSDLIVELTGKYVAAMFSKPTKLPTDELPISVAIIYAEETIKQLKEKGYLK